MFCSGLQFVAYYGHEESLITILDRGKYILCVASKCPPFFLEHALMVGSSVE